MQLPPILKKELQVVVHGQSARFRVVKYAIIFFLLGALYFWQGLLVTGYTLLGMVVASVGIHFLFRYKTNGWTKSWGLYKSIV